MNRLKKLLVGAVAATAFSTSAYAVPINVGGVIFDPDHFLDFSGTSATLTQTIDQTSGVLSGFGVVTTINGVGYDEFCSGCELTLSYGGFTPNGSVIVPTSTTKTLVTYSGGWLKLYVDSTPNVLNPFDPTSLTSANVTDGTLWADLTGHSFGGTTFTGQITNPPGASSRIRLLGEGYFDIVGGLAFNHLDTNTIGGADIAVGTTLSTVRVASDGKITFASGAADFSGNSVPEPGAIALFGLGLFGLALARRRKFDVSA